MEFELLMSQINISVLRLSENVQGIGTRSTPAA